MNRPLIPLLLLIAAMAAAPRSVFAQATRPSSAQVKLSVSTEDNQKLIVATVTIGGKPVESAKVTFFARRTFGNLSLGTDTTLDDGTAAVAFPTDLPGTAQGRISVSATVSAPARYAGATAHADFDGAMKSNPQSDALPRALWAPRAPILLIVTITVILVSVWSAYAFVVLQLFAISRRR